MNLPKLVCVVISITLFVTLAVPGIVFAEAEQNTSYVVESFLDTEGRGIDAVIVPGQPPEIKSKKVVASPESNPELGINILSNVPAFDWSYGCSPTAAAMLFGYYDNAGYADMYIGPENDGVCPQNNSAWGKTLWPSGWVSECPLSATHKGIDGLEENGHIDDYWIDCLCLSPDPYTAENRTEHQHDDCAADFMGTSQYSFDNGDGITTFYFRTDGGPLNDYTECEPNERDGTHGLRLFAESCGYEVVQNYSQYIDGKGSNPNLGFTFDDYRSEIDAGRPVMIQVEGHSMIGYGYNTDRQIVYIHDTWDHYDHEMVWGDSYQGLDHYGVTVIQLQSLPMITPCNSEGIEMHQFVPGDSVWVKGNGLEANMEYKIWVQDNTVIEGTSLAAKKDPSHMQETIVTGPDNGNPAGGFPAVNVWTIPTEYSSGEYDIILDDQDGIYELVSDGMGSVSIVISVLPTPELPTFVLLGLGLAGLYGYSNVRRRGIV